MCEIATGASSGQGIQGSWTLARGAEHGDTFETLKHVEPAHPEGTTDQETEIFGEHSFNWENNLQTIFYSKLKSLQFALWAKSVREGQGGVASLY